jgi:hypothetical protein
MPTKRNSKSGTLRTPAKPSGGGDVLLCVRIPRGAYDVLSQFRRTGLFGHTVEEAAERIICKWMYENIGRE